MAEGDEVMRVEFFGYELILQKIPPSDEEREAWMDEMIRQNKILQEAGYPEEMWRRT